MSTIRAFTSPQVQRLAGLTARRLDYWDETGVYRPIYTDERPHRAYRRIYTFRDVVSLRTLVRLRDEFQVPLEELRRTGHYLTQFTDVPWTKRFWVQGRSVLFSQPGTDVVGDRRGQVSYVDYGAIWGEVAAESERLSRRRPEDVGKIDRHRHVQHNQWVVKGTRIPTASIWRFHQAGFGIEEIIKQFPNLEAPDVVAAIEHERTAAA